MPDGIGKLKLGGRGAFAPELSPIEATPRAAFPSAGDDDASSSSGDDDGAAAAPPPPPC